MIIGIDGNEANVEKRVGIGEYSFELFQKFEELKVQSFDVAQDKHVKFKIYLKDNPRNDLPKEREGWSYRVVGPNPLWTQFALPFDLYTHNPRPDVFFTPTHYAPRWSPVPTVISVMDLSFLYYPKMFRQKDLYQLRNWTAYSVKNAAKIFTISKASRSDIIKKYRISGEKVIVTYPGVKQAEKNVLTKENMEKIREKYGIKGDFILFVGTLQPRKNITRLIEAFSKVSNKDLQLVIVGKKGWLFAEILQAPKKYNVVDSVLFLDFVPDGELSVLYQNALCFVLPSLYEGFGLPILEAMKYGCPVITSNVSSLPEVGGDAVLYVDPSDTDDIAAKMEEVLGDSSLREKMKEKGYVQVKKFSWEKTAKKTLEILMEVAHGR